MTSELVGRSKTKLTHKVAMRTKLKTVYVPVTKEVFRELGPMSSSERTAYLLSMAKNPLYKEEIVVEETARLVRVPEGGKIDYSQENKILPGGINTSHKRLKVVSSGRDPITIKETTDPNGISYLAAEHAENIQPKGIGARMAVISNILAVFFPRIFPGPAAENEKLNGNPLAPITPEQKAGLRMAGTFDENRRGAVQEIMDQSKGIVYSQPSITAVKAYEQGQREWMEPGGSRTIAVRPSGGSWRQRIGKIATETLSPDCPVDMSVIFEARATGHTVAAVIDSRNRSEEQEAGAEITYILGGREVSEREWEERRRN